MPDRMPTLRPVRVSGATRLKASDYGSASAADHDQRGSAASRGYGTRWRKARATVLAREPLCRPSIRLAGKVVAADTLDHWYPHCGLSWLFWMSELWVPMAAGWHSADKQALEDRGELALDAVALQLGLPVLSALEPVKVWEWRKAFAEERASRAARPKGGLSKP